MELYAKDIMSQKLISLHPEMSLEEATEVLLANKISGAPVISSNGALVGVISLYDIFSNAGLNFPFTHNYFEETQIDRILAQEGLHLESVTSGDVSDVMTPTVHTVSPDTTVQALACTMFKQRIHRVIVLKPNTQIPVGVVSTFDLLKVLAEATPAGIAV